MGLSARVWLLCFARVPVATLYFESPEGASLKEKHRNPGNSTAHGRFRSFRREESTDAAKKRKRGLLRRCAALGRLLLTRIVAPLFSVSPKLFRLATPGADRTSSNPMHTEESAASEDKRASLCRQPTSSLPASSPRTVGVCAAPLGYSAFCVARVPHMRAFCLAPLHHSHTRSVLSPATHSLLCNSPC